MSSSLLNINAKEWYPTSTTQNRKIIQQTNEKKHEKNSKNFTNKKIESKINHDKNYEHKFHDDREHLNLVFIGHVDAGKSTTCGNILVKTGQADERLITKYKDIAKSKNRESWWIAYIMDTSEEERNKGKTVEVGRAMFSTKKKRYTILDAPGHKNYVPAMIGGASQADVGILVISARRGEFEAGFQRGGQTREHAMLAKTLGITKLIIAVNKMDDETVKWSKLRYDLIVKKITAYLKQCGYKEKDIVHIPISALKGDGLIEKVDKNICSWNKSNSLLGSLDNLSPIKRDPNKPVRVPIIDSYKDMGNIIVIGKVESGILESNSQLIVVPSCDKIKCDIIKVNETNVTSVGCGENVNIFIKDSNSLNLHSGDILCSVNYPARKANLIESHLMITELLDHKPLLTAGYHCVLHIHTAIVECEIIKLICEYDKMGKKKSKVPHFVRSGTQIKCQLKLASITALEQYSEYAQLGRFTLRDEGKTIAIGKVLDIVN